MHSEALEKSAKREGKSMPNEQHLQEQPEKDAAASATAQITPEFLVRLGEIAFLHMCSQAHRGLSVAGMDLTFLPALQHDQCRFYRKEAGPIAVVAWAWVSDELDARLQKEDVVLAREDWQSGDNLWIMEIIAPFGNADAVLSDLAERVVKDTPCKIRRRQSDGSLLITPVNIGDDAEDTVLDDMSDPVTAEV
ncbi:toxin-activating lysine-acyltransferase [Epibacterium sp. Ofav1-8]|uniref:toxin-activating lysine-acyltransferase n=1 Tax=Epibacterium sp. Ofav1-8 TaxID=2917735 RepID=UPI001EF52A03|nr:toxin-activating lysine-acyltransferase [Epibacterium sp. Ofav1-8]MCG7626091.1 toxin-activating lysine-acyltransferase [Epibacterium sp. Ofav1-8]